MGRSSNNMGQPAYPVPADQVMTASQRRDLFLQSALYKSIPMAPQTWSTGSTALVDVPRTGLAHKVRLYVSLSVTASAAGLAVSQRAPYNLITNVQYLDPSGIRRVDVSPYELYLRQIVTRQWGLELSNGNVGSWSSPAGVSSQIFNNPTPGTGAQTVCFFVDIPISMSRKDTRGTLLLESATSPSYISITFNGTLTAAAGVESPYVGAQTITAISGTVTPVYYYWAPVWVDINGSRTLPIPEEDLQIIHEVISVRGPAALQASSDNPYTLPTGRSYYRLLAQYVNNGAFNGTNLTGVSFRYDQSTKTLNESLSVYYTRIREELDRDLPLGIFLWDMVDRPWDSNQYGSLEAILTLDGTAITAPAYMQFLRECLYIAPQS